MNIISPIVAHAETQGDKVAIIIGDKRITYETLVRRAGCIAANLAQRGVKPGDVVAIRCDLADFVCITLGIAWAGATSISFAGLDPDELEDMTRFAGVSFIVTYEKNKLDPLPQWMPAAATLRELQTEGAPDIPVADCADDATWRIGFSSGTTGHRKVIRFGHASSHAKSDLLSRVPKIRGDITLIYLGFALTFAVVYWMRELARGTTVALMDSRQDALDAIAKSQADLIVSSPANAVELVRLIRRTGRRVPPCVKTVMVGGAPISQAHRKLVREYVCPNLWSNYGATEIGLVALVGPELMATQPASAGRVMPWVELEVIGDDGKPLPPLAEGVLRYRSPMLASGYILPPDASDADRHAFDDGWFLSSDRGFVTEGKLLFLAGRESDVINLGGHKVDSAVIESVVEDFPGVLECAAIGVPAISKGAVQVAIFYVSEELLDSDELVKHCAAHLDRWHAPSVYMRVPKLPRNEGGKVMRAGLIAQMRKLAQQKVET